ncbi:MAG: 4Fe-4S dicluster domain-containing protein, partial [Spirochaetota bacterium]
VPLKYPVENMKVLNRAFRKHDASVKKDDTIWVIDVQGVEAVGTCLADGVPLHKRIAAIGGPGQSNPRHISVRIGTPLSALVREMNGTENPFILRGGLINGTPVMLEEDAVHYDDDGFFFLPKMTKREFLSFLRPGFKRTSFLPCFISRITGAPDSQVSTALRGEYRPCIACGICEKICPSGLMPQIIHRYLYREALDESEAVGIDLCVECGLCTYVCPSKIDLKDQFITAKEKLSKEHAEIESQGVKPGNYAS